MDATVTTATTEENLDHLDPTGLYFHFWPKYEEAARLALRREREVRDEAFAEVTRPVAGEELRLMTPRDLFLLDAFDSPFVVRGRAPELPDSLYFLWLLNAQNRGNVVARAFRRGAMNARIAALDEHEVAAEISIYCERMFLIDENEPAAQAESRPSSVSFMAELLVSVAATLGVHDPMTGKLLADTPIPRLLQYRDAQSRREGRNEATALDSARSRCLEDVYKVMMARRERENTGAPCQ